MTKECSKCKQVKPITEFTKRESAPDGYRGQCKECRRIRARKYWHNHKELCHSWQKKYSQTEKGKVANIRGVTKYLKTEKGRKKHLERQTQYQKEHPEQAYTKTKIYQAIKAGKFPPANSRKCRFCSKIAHHYHHHWGYARAQTFDVIPLCAACHKKLHLGQVCYLVQATV